MPTILPRLEQLARFMMNRGGFESRVVSAAGVDIHVYEGRGTGALPTVVLLHGLGASGSSFTNLVGRLRPHVRRVIVPELPGHGFSDYPNQRVTPLLLRDTVIAALDEMLDEPAIVYGNSLGGALALQLAIHRPRRVHALVLASPAGARLTDDESSELTSAFAIHTRRDAKRFIARVYHQPPLLLKLVAHELPAMFRRPAVRDVLETVTPDDAPHRDELAALTMPILLMWGRSERLLPASALAYFREHLPAHAIIEEPWQIGHVPQVEAPRLVGDRILAFARESSPSRAEA